MGPLPTGRHALQEDGTLCKLDKNKMLFDRTPKTYRKSFKEAVIKRAYAEGFNCICAIFQAANATAARAKSMNTRSSKGIISLDISSYDGDRTKADKGRLRESERAERDGERVAQCAEEPQGHTLSKFCGSRKAIYHCGKPTDSDA